MRTAIVSICTTLAVIAAVSVGSASHAEPLAPGKPAGVRAAQMGNKEWLVIGGIGVVAAAFLIANVGGDAHAAGPPQTITVVTPTTT